MAKKYNKQFERWAEVARMLDAGEKSFNFHNGEIYWCSVGVNIGAEECGKGFMYCRPVLIFHKINNRLFRGILFTTTPQENDKYTEIVKIDGEISYALITQINTYSVKRLGSKMCDLPEEIYRNIIRKFYNYRPSTKR